MEVPIVRDFDIIAAYITSLYDSLYYIEEVGGAAYRGGGRRIAPELSEVLKGQKHGRI